MGESDLDGKRGARTAVGVAVVSWLLLLERS